MHIALYLRISQDPLNLAAGVGRQRTDCTAIARARWPEHEIVEYVDNDISASKYSKRARVAFHRMCEQIAAGEVYAMVGWNFDRVFRQPRELEAFLDLCEAQKFTRAVTAQGDVDLTSDDGRLHARILVAVAAKESDDKSRRVRRALKDRDEGGVHRGGKVVFGYQMVDGVPVQVPAHADLVRQAALDVLGGTPLRQVAQRMPAGAPRTGSGVRRMLLSPTLAGRTKTGQGTWERILTDVEAADLRSMLLAPHRRSTAPSGKRLWWLSGLVVCGKCGEKMRVAIEARRDKAGVSARNYQCRPNAYGVGCGSVAIRADKLHWQVEIALFDVVTARERVRVGTGGGGDDATGEHVGGDSGAEDRLTELAALYATGEISRAEWVAARDVLIHREPRPVSVLQPVPDLAARWEGLTPEQRHQHASRVIETVTVLPRVPGGARFQADRVQIRWLQ